MKLRSLSILMLLVGFIGLTACKSLDPVQEPDATIEVLQNQNTFPNKQIQIVIPYAPGGGTDSVARALTLSANNYFSQPILAVNKLGESGARGLKEGLYSENDGYTVTLITTELNSLSAFEIIDFNHTDIEPLILLNSEPGVVVVAKDFPFDSMEALITHMHTNTTSYTIGSAGLGSIWNLAAKGVEKEADITFESQYYNGTSLAVLDVLGHKIDLVIAGISEVDEHLANKELKVLTILADERDSLLPEVKTFKEMGYEFSIYTWRGLAIPKGVDQASKDYLLENFSKAALDQDYIDLLTELGLHYDYRKQEDFKDFLQKDLEFYQALNESLGGLEQ